MTSSVLNQAAKTVTVFLVVFGVAGALWGWWRPAVTAVVSDRGGVVVDPSSTGAPFEAFAVYAVVTGLLVAARCLGLWRTPALRGGRDAGGHRPGPGRVGGVPALLELPADAIGGDSVGGRVPGDNLSSWRYLRAIGYLAVPAALAITYWACALFSPDEAFSR